MQSLKSASSDRVRLDRAARNYSARFNGGFGEFCPAGSGDLSYDVYGRPISNKTINFDDSSCSNYTGISTTRMLSYENNNRPYLPIAGAGSREYSDTMGRARDIMPKDVYHQQQDNSFHRHYQTPNNGPPNEMTWVPKKFNYPVPYKSFPMSHDVGGGSYKYQG